VKNIYDVVVVGAGPIGSHTAYQLADKGFSVCLLDEKEKIGENIVCTGIISKDAFKRYDLPSKSILSRIDSFCFVSPREQRLEYSHPDVFAYVVSREIFDKGLLGLAKKFGVDVHLNRHVTEIAEASHCYKIKCGSKLYRGRTVVLATGVNAELHTQVGLGKPLEFLYGSQVEIPISMASTKIEIHIGRKFAPGSFGWVVPADRDCARIGVIVEKGAKACLEHLLKERLKISDEDIKSQDMGQKPITYGPIECSVNDRILAVGEAAGQVKTTTGGGIFYGLLCSEIAVDKLSKTLRNGNNLEDYEVTWRSALISELDIGRRLRKIAKSLDDEAIENLFSFVKQNKFWVELLVPRINFDYHSNALFFCLKSFGLLLGIKNNGT
jgi:digeranylgeranylglycerophospholipid reductase